MARFTHVARRWRRLRLDTGDTLIEVLITVSIIGIAMVAITAGMGVSIVTSDIHHKQAVSGTLLTNYVEAVQLAPYVAVTCPLVVPTAYVTATVSGTVMPSGYTQSVVSTTANPFEYWSASASRFQSTCPGTDGGAQRMWLQVASADRRAVETVQFVKRKP